MTKLLSKDSLTFEEACKIAKGMEITSNDMEALKSDSQVNRIGVFAKSILGPRPEENSRGRKSRFANYQCYHCSEYGHTV